MQEEYSQPYQQPDRQPPQQIPDSPPAPAGIASFSDLLGGAFSIFRTQFQEFLKLFAILLGIQAVVLLHAVIDFGELFDLPFYVLMVLPITMAVVAIVSQILITISFIYLVKERAEGISAGRAFKLATKKLFAYIWIAILAALIVAGGYMLLIVPGIVLSVWFAFAYYVMAEENRGGMNALLRSKQLVEGKFSSVFLRLLGFAIIAFASIIVFTLFPRAILFFPLENQAFIMMLSIVLEVWDSILGTAVSFLGIAYGFLLYGEVKRVKGNPEFVNPPLLRKLKYVAVGIVGIILGGALTFGLIVWVSLSSIQQTGRDAQRISDVRQIDIALQVYRLNHGYYPMDLEELESDNVPIVNVITGEPYNYEVLEGGESFRICIELEKREDTCRYPDRWDPPF